MLVFLPGFEEIRVAVVAAIVLEEWALDHATIPLACLVDVDLPAVQVTQVTAAAGEKYRASRLDAAIASPVREARALRVIFRLRVALDAVRHDLVSLLGRPVFDVWVFD